MRVESVQWLNVLLCSCPLSCSQAQVQIGDCLAARGKVKLPYINGSQLITYVKPGLTVLGAL